MSRVQRLHQLGRSASNLRKNDCDQRLQVRLHVGAARTAVIMKHIIKGAAVSAGLERPARRIRQALRAGGWTRRDPTGRGAASKTDPSQPLESETTRVALWPLLLIGVGLVLTLAWAGALLWMTLQALAGVVTWLFA